MRSSWLLRKILLAAIADTDISFSEYQCEDRGGLRSVCPGVHILGGCRYGGVHSGGGPQRWGGNCFTAGG